MVTYTGIRNGYHLAIHAVLTAVQQTAVNLARLQFHRDRVACEQWRL